MPTVLYNTYSQAHIRLYTHYVIIIIIVHCPNSIETGKEYYPIRTGRYL